MGRKVVFKTYVRQKRSFKQPKTPLLDLPSSIVREKTIKFFEEDDWLKRIDIVKEIGFIGIGRKNELFLVLSEMLNWEKHPNVRATIFDVLRFAEPNKSALLLISGIMNEDYAKLSALESLSKIKGVKLSLKERIGSILLDMIKKETDSNLKGYLILALSNFNERRGLKLAMDHFTSNNHELREFAVKTFGKTNYAKGLKLAIKDKHWAIRLIALLEIEKLGKIKLLKRLLKDNEWYIRKMAVKAVGKGHFNINKKKKLLKKALKDKNPSVVSEAIRWIMKNNIYELADDLSELCTHLNVEISGNAIEAYKELTGKEPPKKSLNYSWLNSHNNLNIYR